MSISSADFALKFENVVRNNVKKRLFTIVQPILTALWKGRVTISIFVAITEFLKINHCCVFVFLYILTYRGRVCFVLVENSTDYNFLLYTYLISSSFHFTWAERSSKCYMLGNKLFFK